MKTLKKKRIALLIGLAMTIIVLVFSWDLNFTATDFLPRLNHYLYDINLKLFHGKKKHKNQIVIVDIDEQSLAAEGKWPWPRNKLAHLLDRLNQAGVAVVAFDIMFPEKDRNAAKMLLAYAAHKKGTNKTILNYLQQQTPHFDHDRLFAQSLSRGDSVLGIFFHNKLHHSVGSLGKPFMRLPPNSTLVVRELKRYTGPIAPLMQAARHTGFVTTIPDKDGVLRRTPLFIKHNNALYPSLALETAKLYLLQDNVTLDIRNIDNLQVLLGVHLGKTDIPTDASGNMLIPYQGPAFSFPYLSATKVLQGNFSPDMLAGKIVLIGSSAVGIGDLPITPLQSAGYPGVEVHANVLNAILNKDFIISPVWATGLERVLITLLGLLLSVGLLYCSATVLFLTIVGLDVAVFALQFLLWTQWNFIWPHAILLHLLVIGIGLFNLCYAYLFEVRYRHQLRGLYGQYVSNQHLDEMLEDPKLYTQGGVSKEMSVLFADIRSFTSISEKLNADGVKQFLNQLFTPLTKIIFNHKGTIDKYVGDMIVAFWSDPIPDPQHAEHAVTSALMMIAKVKELSPTFEAQGLPKIRIGVGINTGVMHVGDMGSQYRRSYTVLGDAVNQGSRFEASTKFYGADILVAESTKQYCNDVIFRFVDKVKVKGKETAINIYEPLCMKQDLTDTLKQALQTHEQALNAYFKQDWTSAKQLFETLVQQCPDVQVYQMFLERTSTFLQSPPSESWDGAFKRTEK